MTWGSIGLGRLTLREGYTANANGGQSLTVKGQESSPPLTTLQMEQRREDLLGMVDQFVPATFTSKARLNGFYRVAGAKAEYAHYQDANVLTLDWTVDLDRVGTEFEVDHESRLSGPLTRNTSHAATGERWLAPPLGHYGFWSSSTSPSSVSRTGADGAILVWRGVPAVNPRWGTTPAGALAGRVRFLDANGSERSGVNFTPAPTGWELQNGLVRVTVDSPGVLNISAYTGGAWRSKLWTLSDGSALGLPTSTTLLRNNLENVVLRLLWASTSAPGRLTADITLRRGSRFAELYLRRSAAATLSVTRSAVEAATAGTGYVRATANDADGNRYVLGSALAFTNDLVNGGLSKAATASLDVFVGVAAAGSGAVSGDQPDHLRDQYLGSPNELVTPVRR